MAGPSSWPARACVPAAACATTSSTISVARIRASCSSATQPLGLSRRRISDGAKQVDIFGENIPVRARIYTINGFSAHADQSELLAWQKQTGAKRTFLVH